MSERASLLLFEMRQTIVLSGHTKHGGECVGDCTLLGDSCWLSLYQTEAVGCLVREYREEASHASCHGG